MVDDENDVSSGTFWQALERIAEGGVLRVLAGKPVEQAIGRLISGASDIPAAYLEQWAQSVRSDTAARKQLTSKLASAVRIKAVEDDELIGRGLERWTRQLGRTQKAREEVGLRTLDVLIQDHAETEHFAPSEDFMSAFEEVAEKASSDDIANLRGGFQNSRASLGATRNMHAAWSRLSTMKPSRS